MEDMPAEGGRAILTAIERLYWSKYRRVDTDEWWERYGPRLIGYWNVHDYSTQQYPDITGESVDAHQCMCAQLTGTPRTADMPAVSAAYKALDALSKIE